MKMPEVLQIFDYMHEVGVIPDERTYSLLIDAHVVNRDPKGAMEALNLMVRFLNAVQVISDFRDGICFHFSVSLFPFVLYNRVLFFLNFPKCPWSLHFLCL